MVLSEKTRTETTHRDLQSTPLVRLGLAHYSCCALHAESSLSISGTKFSSILHLTFIDSHDLLVHWHYRSISPASPFLYPISHTVSFVQHRR